MKEPALPLVAAVPVTHQTGLFQMLVDKLGHFKH